MNSISRSWSATAVIVTLAAWGSAAGAQSGASPACSRLTVVQKQVSSLDSQTLAIVSAVSSGKGRSRLVGAFKKLHTQNTRYLPLLRSQAQTLHSQLAQAQEHKGAYWHEEPAGINCLQQAADLTTAQVDKMVSNEAILSKEVALGGVTLDASSVSGKSNAASSSAGSSSGSGASGGASAVAASPSQTGSSSLAATPASSAASNTSCQGPAAQLFAGKNSGSVQCYNNKLYYFDCGTGYATDTVQWLGEGNLCGAVIDVKGDDGDRITVAAPDARYSADNGSFNKGTATFECRKKDILNGNLGWVMTAGSCVVSNASPQSGGSSGTGASSGGTSSVATAVSGTPASGSSSTPASNGSSSSGGGTTSSLSFSYTDPNAVNPFPVGWGPDLATPTPYAASIMFFGADFYSKVAKAIGGASSDPWNTQMQIWSKQYAALNPRDLNAVESWRQGIAAVISGSAKPDVLPLNGDGKTPYNGDSSPTYTQVPPPAAWTALLKQLSDAQAAAVAQAAADAAAKLPPPPPTTVEQCGIYAYLAGPGSVCYDIGVKAGLIKP